MEKQCNQADAPTTSACATSSTYPIRRRRNPAVLIRWIEEHPYNPYPTKAEKHYLAFYAGMTQRQLNDWFANARRNIKKVGYESWKKKHSGFSAILAGIPLQGSSFPLITSNPPFACTPLNCRSPTSGPPPTHTLPPTHGGLVNGALTNGMGTPSSAATSLSPIIPTQYYPDHGQASTNGLKHSVPVYNGSSPPASSEGICSYIRPALTWIPPGTAGQYKPHLAGLITVDANPATPCQCQASPIATAQTAVSTATEPSQWNGSSEHVGYGWQVSSEETGSTEDGYYEGSPANMSL